MMTTRSISKELSNLDRSAIAGIPDISYHEPEQLYPETQVVSEESKKVSTSERLRTTRDRASEILVKIESLKEKVDSRCSRFSISSPDGVGSKLYQAMFRLFGKKTTTVTYADYKAALQMRQKLAEEEATNLRTT